MFWSDQTTPCSPIHKQTGRDKISQTMLSNLGSVAFGNQTQYPNKGYICSRQEKFSGRSIIQIENSSIRMDPKRYNSSVIVQHMGSTNDRSLCISRQSQETNLYTPVEDGTYYGITRGGRAGGVQFFVRSISPKLL